MCEFKRAKVRNGICDPHAKFGAKLVVPSEEAAPHPVLYKSPPDAREGPQLFAGWGRGPARSLTAVEGKRCSCVCRMQAVRNEKREAATGIPPVHRSAARDADFPGTPGERLLALQACFQRCGSPATALALLTLTRLLPRSQPSFLLEMQWYAPKIPA